MKTENDAPAINSYSALPNNTNESWWQVYRHAERDAGMRTGMLHIVVLYTAVYSLGYDGSLLNGLQALPPWGRDFNHPAGYDLGLISASYYLPKIPAAFLIAWIADKYGRKAPIFIGSILMFAGSLAGAFCHTRAQLIGSRILLGVGTASGQIGAASLIPELSHPRIRHMAGGFLTTMYYVGSILSAWICFSMVYFPGGSSWAWRIPTLVQGLGPFFLFVGLWFVPQSPRWLVKNKRIEEAHAILATYHANGKMDDPLVLMELKEIEAAVITEDLAKTGSWMTFVRTSGGRRRAAIIFMIGTATQWAGNGIVSYYLVPVLKQVGITKPPQTAGINGALAISNFIFAIVGALNVERIGRRPLFLGSVLGMIVCFSIMCGVAGGYAKTHNAATGVAIVPFIFLFMASYSMALTPLPTLYVPEISPLALRAKSAALLSLSQNIAQAFNQFVNPIALKSLAWKYYFIYIAALAFYLVGFFLFIRETKGLTTEEAAVVYDPDDKKDAALAAEQKLRQAAEAALDEKLGGAGSFSHVEDVKREKV